VRLDFLSPSAALIGLAVAVPLLTFVLSESRARTARAVLRLPPPLGRGWAYAVAIAAFAALVSVGAAQPVLERERSRAVRADAEAIFVFDTTRSMAAADSPDSPTRFERALGLGGRMRFDLPELRIGIASLTDRVLPHLFASASDSSFRMTLDKAVGIERPASVQRGNALGSSLEALGGVPDAGFFSRGDKRRLLVVFTDAETRPFNRALLSNAFRRSGITTILVRVGDESERVYTEAGVPDPRYRSPGGAAQAAEAFAEATGGSAFAEGELDEAIAAARRAAGEGKQRAESKEVEPTPLAAWAFGAAFLPLAFLLWRRNLR
jgi:hypothetical protein